MNSNIDPSIGTRVIVGGDKAVKVFAPAIRSSHTASENRSVRVSEDNGFDKRRITNKHKGHTGYREKQALEELKDSEVLMQNAMDRLYTSGRIRTIAATVNDKSAATELMNRHNFYGKLLTFDILDMTVVKGMNLAKLEVREVGGHYRKEPSVSKGDRLFGLFKHGSDISGLCQLLDTRVLKVIDPTIVQCQRSRNFYCLIKYFRVDRL